MRTTNHKLTRRVHEVLDVVVEESKHLGRVYLLLHPRHEDVDDVGTNLFLHGSIAGKLVVLSGNDNGINALGHASIAVLHGHLAFRVGTEIGHHPSFLPDVCQRAHDEVGQVERHRHIALCLVGSIAKHHSLVACSLLLLVAIVNTSADVTTLLVDGTEDAAGVSVELILRLGVANALDGLSGYRLQVDIDIAPHFAHEHDLSCGDKRLTGHTCLLIVGQELV